MLAAVIHIVLSIICYTASNAFGFKTLAAYGRASSSRRATTYDIRLQEAKDIVGHSVDNDTATRVAFALLEKEKEFALLEKEKEKEKETELVMLKKDMEKELALQKKDTECIREYYKQRLSIIVQRVVFEAFLTDIFEVYNTKNGSVFHAINSSSEYSKKIRLEAAKDFPKKNILDTAIRNDRQIREAVWDFYAIDKNVPYPLLPNEIVYGVLSFIVHNYEYNTVLISDQAPPDYIQFFEALTDYQRKVLKKYSAVDAAAGQLLESSTL